jgi:hypothetical protein
VEAAVVNGVRDVLGFVGDDGVEDVVDVVAVIEVTVLDGLKTLWTMSKTLPHRRRRR